MRWPPSGSRSRHEKASSSNWPSLDVGAEIAPGITAGTVQAATDAPLALAPDLREMQFT